MDGIGTTMTFARGADGRVILNINDAKNAKVENVGNVAGSAQLQFGVTGDEDVTQYLFKHEGDSDNQVTLSNTDGNHYNFVGENFNIDSKGGNAKRTIQMDTTESNLDLTNAGGNQFVYMGEESQDNKTHLGYGNNNYIDAGKFNYVDVGGGSGQNRFESTSTAHGSVMKGGSGNDSFVIGGKYGVYDGGAGNDKFEAVGMFGEDEDASYRNIVMGGDGNDTMIDKGGYNIFFGGNGKNTYDSQGSKGIAILGPDSDGEAIFGSSSDHSYVFTKDEMTSGGKKYNVNDIMKKYGWTLNEFLNVYSQISETNPDSLGNHDTIDSETMKKLELYFVNNLKK